MNQMMKNKKAIAMLLLIAMMFSIMPTAVLASDGSAETTTAYVTIVDKGEIVVAHEAVTVTTGSAIIDDFLKQAHEDFYIGESDSFASDGSYITKLWGVETGNIGFYLNNASAWSLAEPVKNGDHVVAFIYQHDWSQEEQWLDLYSYFNVHIITTTSGSIVLNLQTDEWGLKAPLENANILINGSNEGDYKTDSEGNVEVSFSEEKDYVITASHETECIVPPICVVTYDTKGIWDGGNQGDSGEDDAIASTVTVGDIPVLLENIAETYMNSSDDKWKIWGMAQYALLNSDTDFNLTDKTKQEYLNLVVDAITADNPTEADYNNAVITLTALGFDPTKIYPVNSNTPIDAVKELKKLGEFSADAWSAPYTLAALNQSDKYEDSNIENQLITKILASQNNDGWWADSWGGKTQATAHMLIGLSYYQDINDEVKKAIDKAVKYLKSKQEKNGSFSDGYGAEANTTAIVILGLSSVGINPNEVKNIQGYSAIDGLLSFALNKKTGFDYSDNKSFNDFATKQAYLALIAAYQVMQDNVEAFNVYDFSGNELTPGRATGAGVVVGPSAPPADNDDITVKMSVRADNGYWMRNQSVTVKEGSTVYHALIKALEKYGMQQEGAEYGYVEEITYNGRTLAEFDLGPNSGWLYTVNGELPEKGLLEYKLHNGDNILWYYTEDWTQDSLAGSRVDDKDKEDEESKPTTTPVNEVFKDVDTHWASASIQFVYDNGILKGVSATDFAPEATFNRAMMATVLHRLAGNPEHGWHYPFRDVFDMAWYCGPIAWAYENNLIGGMTTTSYAPESPITREQLAVMLMRYAQFQGYDTSKSVALYQYQDAGKVSDYAQPAMEWAVSIGLIGGRTLDTLAPQDTATRAEVSVMLERFITMFQPVVEEESTIK